MLSDKKNKRFNHLSVSHRYTICHKTEVVKNTLDPVWQAFKIPVRALCNGDYDRYRDKPADVNVSLTAGLKETEKKRNFVI